MLIIKNPSGEYNISITAGEREEYFTLQTVQIPADGVCFDTAQIYKMDKKLRPDGEYESAKFTEELRIFESSGLGDISGDKISFKAISLKDKTGTVKSVYGDSGFGIAVRSFGMRNVDDLSVSAGSGSNYQLELTVPDSLPEDDYIAEIQIKISNLTNVCALQEMGPWVKESDGSYVKTFKVLVTKGNPRSITVPDTATYTLENGNLRVQGRTEPEGRVVLYIDGTAAKEILADGFGKFNAVYALNSSNEEYEITASAK